VAGFLPQSHVSQGDLAVGQNVGVTVLELNRKDNKIIFSQKPAFSEEDFVKAIKGVKLGDKVEATVTNVSSFGVFATIAVKEQTIEAFIHISEIAWEKVNDLVSLYTAGDKVEAVIIRFDNEARRINLSVKRLTADPFEKLMEAYPVDKKVTGTVAKVDENGVTVTLDENPSAGSGQVVEGLIRKEKIPPTVTYTVGQEVSVTVAEFDKRRHKIVVVPVLKEKPLMYR
jgi:small subunit ribosomal protein S1